MKVLLWLSLVQLSTLSVKTFDLSKIRHLYQRAALEKQDARQLNQLMLHVDVNTMAAVLICYKGANEMIQAKYTFNPIVKFKKFNKGKELIKMAISRDPLSLEMRFIRYSIQSNLPSFLGYREELDLDKRFMVNNTKTNTDPELKKMIFNYLSAVPTMHPDELKQLKN
ncbi:hypothetical protein BH09BAC6_BH09BAC6_27530 [soil metagenome]|jgi:hypothetical protein